MPNSAKWHSSKTQVLCGFEPNSAISLSQAAQCLGTQVALWGGGYGRACADSQRTSTPKARKSFVHLFKGGGVWGETPRPYRGAGAKPPPSHTPKKGDVCPPLGVAQSPGLALSPCGRVRALPCFFPPAAPVSGRNFLKKVSSKTFTRLRRCTFILCIF